LKHLEVSNDLQTSENNVEIITLTIEPNANLKTIVNEVTGVNLYSEKNLGGGFSYNPKIISPNQEGRYSIEYILGSIEEVPEMKLPPTQEQLYELLENARNTTLVIHYQKKN